MYGCAPHNGNKQHTLSLMHTIFSQNSDILTELLAIIIQKSFCMTGIHLFSFHGVHRLLERPSILVFQLLLESFLSSFFLIMFIVSIINPSIKNS